MNAQPAERRPRWETEPHALALVLDLPVPVARRLLARHPGVGKSVTRLLQEGAQGILDQLDREAEPRAPTTEPFPA